MKSVTKACRHGTLSFFPDDEYVGKSLLLYGEYGEDELLAMRKILSPGDVVVEVGANLGSLTVPMAKMVGPNGRIIAFEPQPMNAALLRLNVKNNQLDDVVEVYGMAAGSVVGGVGVIPKLSELGHRNFGAVEMGGGSHKVAVTTIDSFDLDKLTLLKIDAEGSERDVLMGAAETIKRLKPILYVENDRQEKSIALIAAIVDMGYRPFWHRAPLWNPKNFGECPHNAFGQIVSINMLCVPEDSGIEVDGMEGVADVRLDPPMYEREIARYERLLKYHPADLKLRLTIAHLCNLTQQTERARALLDQNLAVDPEHLPTRLISGLYHLQHRNWKQGWANYELRYQQPETMTFGDRPHTGRRWDGTPTDDPLLVWHEQGYGDSIMFSRWLPEVFRRAPNAFVEVQSAQYELFEQSGLVPLGRLCRIGRSLPHYAQHISLPSLPHALGVETDDDIRSKPYLKADSGLIDLWRARVSNSRIGFCWKGSPRSERHYTRDMDPTLLEPIRQRYGPFFSLTHEGQFDGFADTAACIMALDMVISVDTSVAHLAGALGKECWLLLATDPDWRWDLKGSTTPWYDSMRIFRQPKLLDWLSAVEEISHALDARQQRVAA